MNTWDPARLRSSSAASWRVPPAATVTVRAATRIVYDVTVTLTLFAEPDSALVHEAATARLVALALWDPAWDHEAAQLHREKGTVAALRRVLEAIGAVYDYAEPADAPFTATVTVHNTSALLLEDLADLSPQLERVTRASVHLTLQTEDGFCVPIDVAGGLGVVTLAPALRVA